MEYPGLFTALTFTWMEKWPFDKIRFPEIVTIHEFGHEYWYGMVGSNEFEESWLDEGINSFTEASVIRKAYGDKAYELPGGLAMSDFAYYRGSYLVNNVDPILRNSWSYANNGEYGTNSYYKPGLILRQMENDLGEATFARCIRAYFERWSYRHPDTDDFFDTFEDVSKRDLSAYRNLVFRQNATLDFSVVSAKSSRETGRGGMFGNSHEPVKEEKRDRSKPTYRSTVIVARSGSLPIRGQVVMRFSNGHVEKRVLPSNATWGKYEFLYPHELESVQIDPGLESLWDTNLLNNSKRLSTDSLAVNKASGRADSLIVHLLQLLWMFV
jgi:hypothetical protein